MHARCTCTDESDVICFRKHLIIGEVVEEKPGVHAMGDNDVVIARFGVRGASGQRREMGCVEASNPPCP